MTRMLRRIARTALGATAIVTVAAAQADTPGNPIFPGADPSAITVGKELWIFPTRAGQADHFEAWSSTDGKSWRQRGTTFSLTDAQWIADDGATRHGLWAPDVRRVGQHYVLYYSVGPQNPTPSRLGVAVADRPEGTYRDTGKPLLTGGNGFEAIDPMMFTDPKTGTHYLYAGGSAGAKLRLFVLDADATAIDHEVNVAQPPNFTEGAYMHERDGTYYLSYSHGVWKDSTYSVHYATAPSPTGPWTYRGAILTSDSTHQGPGHHAFVRNPHGQWVIVYHRWESPPTGGTPNGTRQVAIEPVRYAADGTILPITMTDR